LGPQITATKCTTRLLGRKTERLTSYMDDEVPLQRAVSYCYILYRRPLHTYKDDVTANAQRIGCAKRYIAEFM
jgi:hypothetical protein